MSSADPPPSVKAPTPLEALLKERVARAVGPEMRAIEEAIAAEIASPVHLIHEMGEFIAGAGGKRLRPILLLMAARMAGYNGPRAVRMGCVVELLHTATLIHDDVVDQAPLRRGRPSANARWGDDASILVGDHLYSKSFALMVADGDPGVLETLARATVSMTEAEVLQLEWKRERRGERGRLSAHHHPEDGVVHLGLLPHRRRCSPRRPSAGSRR